jgi:hypothetical protein
MQLAGARQLGVDSDPEPAITDVLGVTAINDRRRRGPGIAEPRAQGRQGMLAR